MPAPVGRPGRPQRGVSRQRFRAPAPVQAHARPRAGGLGTPPAPAPEQSSEFEELEQTTPTQGFTGYRGRPRFTSPMPLAIAAHGGTMEGYSGEVAEAFDPSIGRSRFPAQSLLVWFDGIIERVRTSALDRVSMALVGEGRLTYQRGRIDATIAGTRPADMIRWGDPPYPQAFREPRYTLRPEFMQDAQTFSGLHTLMRKKGNASSSPVRMRAPRSSRLTFRDTPGSYGQQTEVLNG